MIYNSRVHLFIWEYISTATWLGRLVHDTWQRYSSQCMIGNDLHWGSLDLVSKTHHHMTTNALGNCCLQQNSKFTNRLIQGGTHSLTHSLTCAHTHIHVHALTHTHTHTYHVGFPEHMTYSEFSRRYGALLGGGMTDGQIPDKDSARLILRSQEVDKSSFRIGLSQVWEGRREERIWWCGPRLLDSWGYFLILSTV